MLTYSVVIPVYNAEKYLESCVQSVLRQTGTFEYEVILVNDGSRDNSAALCESLAERDNRIHVIHQTNQGVSAARNAGMDAARGEYILFLDSDDLWAEDFLQNLERTVSEKPDMIEFGYRKFTAVGVIGTVVPDAAFSQGSGMEYFETYSKKMCMPVISCWAAAFKRQLLQKHEIRFPVGVTYGEDFQFHMQSLKCAQTVVSVPEALYLYRENENGVTHTPSLRKAKDQLMSCAKMYRLIPCPMLANYYCTKILYLASLSREEAKQLKQLLRENRDILRHVSGVKVRVAGLLYRVLGWYPASRFMRSLLSAQHAEKG